MTHGRVIGQLIKAAIILGRASVRPNAQHAIDFGRHLYLADLTVVEVHEKAFSRQVDGIISSLKKVESNLHRLHEVDLDKLLSLMDIPATDLPDYFKALHSACRECGSAAGRLDEEKGVVVCHTCGHIKHKIPRLPQEQSAADILQSVKESVEGGKAEKEDLTCGDCPAGLHYHGSDWSGIQCGSGGRRQESDPACELIHRFLDEGREKRVREEFICPYCGESVEATIPMREDLTGITCGCSAILTITDGIASWKAPQRTPEGEPKYECPACHRGYWSTNPVVVARKPFLCDCGKTIQYYSRDNELDVVPPTLPIDPPVQVKDKLPREMSPEERYNQEGAKRKFVRPCESPSRLFICPHCGTDVLDERVIRRDRVCVSCGGPIAIKGQPPTAMPNTAREAADWLRSMADWCEDQADRLIAVTAAASCHSPIDDSIKSNQMAWWPRGKRGIGQFVAEGLCHSLVRKIVRDVKELL